MRVSPHVDENVVNLSVWRDDLCVGTVRLRPDEVAALVAGLTDGLAALARHPAPPSASVGDLEDRLVRLETHLGRPSWRFRAGAAADRVRSALGQVGRLGPSAAP